MTLTKESGVVVYYSVIHIVLKIAAAPLSVLQCYMAMMVRMVSCSLGLRCGLKWVKQGWELNSRM